MLKACLAKTAFQFTVSRYDDDEDDTEWRATHVPIEIHPKEFSPYQNTCRNSRRLAEHLKFIFIQGKNGCGTCCDLISGFNLKLNKKSGKFYVVLNEYNSLRGAIRRGRKKDDGGFSLSLELVDVTVVDGGTSTISLPKMTSSTMTNYSHMRTSGNDWSDTWKTDDGHNIYRGTANLLIHVDLDDWSNLDLPKLSDQNHLNLGSIGKKMLEERLGSDVIFKTSDGATIHCHKCVIMAGSGVFNAMFHENNFVEGVTNTVDLSSTKSVTNAALKFLYCGDLDDPAQDPSLATVLLDFAREYQIPTLQEAVAQLLLEKPSKWYSADDALRVFFAGFPEHRWSNNDCLCSPCTVSDCVNLKRKAIKVLNQMTNTELLESEEYKKLPIENPEALMDLMTAYHFSTVALIE